jgi:hypothetical protein
MTADDSGRDTRLIEIKGRQSVVRQLKEIQLMAMAREAQLLTRPEGVDVQRKLLAITRLMDILESAVVQAVDRQYVIDLSLKGDLEVGDLMKVITIFAEVEPTKPVVRRGRPPKTRV